VIMLLAALVVTDCAAAYTERRWFFSRESLSDYEALLPAATPLCSLVTFNASSGLCAHFRCRLGLSHCRKCRNANKGAQRVWTAGSDCWTTVQHRVSGSVDFYRNWTQYQSEFGEGPDGNYWIGLNSLHELTRSKSRKVRFLITDWDNLETWAEYSSFSVGPESGKYRLNVSGFSTGSAKVGDSFSDGNGMQFSTKDADNDISGYSCAQEYSGAWWFAACFLAHPNGQYKNFSEAIGGPYAQGIMWIHFYDVHYSLKEFEMMVL
uniref:Fibrinogen C-terminal domain-containing protein n=1 Tax=Macrostomum lignano TaxID=282301 RepID=A0A1I8FXJ1_9PLAT